MNVLGDIYAKILADPATRAMMEQALKDGDPNDPRIALYQDILRAAHAHPDTVTVSKVPGLGEAYNAAGAYSPGGDAITYEPQPSNKENLGVVSHELLHFLLTKNAKTSGPSQHALMKNLFGSDKFQTEEQLRKTPIGDRWHLQGILGR